MSRLEMVSPTRAKIVMEGLYKDLERRIEASQPGLCPVDLARAFLELCYAQTCGKCVPCRIGLKQLMFLIQDVLDGKATMDLSLIHILERTVPTRNPRKMPRSTANKVMMRVVFRPPRMYFTNRSSATKLL